LVAGFALPNGLALPKGFALPNGFAFPNDFPFGALPVALAGRAGFLELVAFAILSVPL
jgi:hypothetical protein